MNVGFIALLTHWSTAMRNDANHAFDVHHAIRYENCKMLRRFSLNCVAFFWNMSTATLADHRLMRAYGYIDVSDGYWRRNVLVTMLRC